MVDEEEYELRDTNYGEMLFFILSKVDKTKFKHVQFVAAKIETLLFENEPEYLIVDDSQLISLSIEAIVHPETAVQDGLTMVQAFSAANEAAHVKFYSSVGMNWNDDDPQNIKYTLHWKGLVSEQTAALDQ